MTFALSMLLTLAAMVTSMGAGYCAAQADHHYRAQVWFEMLIARAERDRAVPSGDVVVDLWHQAEKTRPRGLARRLNVLFRVSPGRR